ncbi:hypothetical protein PCE1_003417 [Barthelona sp. PCE]
MSDVPTAAIEEVEFYDNTSCLSAEFIAQRLGLIPFKLFSKNQDGMEGIDALVYAPHCTCASSCERCAPSLTLDVTHDEASMNITQSTTRVITANDLQFVENEFIRVEAVDPKTPIVKLAPGQSLHFRATIRKGRGEWHAKWSPVSKAVFKAMPSVTLNEEYLQDMSEEQRRGLSNSCCARVFDYNDRAKRIEVRNADSCVYCGDCMEYMSNINFMQAIEVGEVKSGEHSIYVFDLESVGQLSPILILKQALNILSKRLDDIKRPLQKSERGGL